MYYNNKALLSIATLTGASLAQTSSSSGGGGGDGGGSENTSTGDGGPSGGFACTQSYASLLAAAPTPTGELGSSFTSYASSLVASGGATANANPLAIATQACDFSSSLPSSLRSDFDAYVTSVIGYVSASSEAIDAVITDCVATGSVGASYTSLVNSFATHTGPLCTGAGGGGGGGGGANDTASPSGPSGTGADTGTGAGGSPTPTATSTGGDGGGVGGGGAGNTSGGGNGGGQTTSTPTGAAAQPTALFGGVAAAAGLLGVAILL